MWNCWNKRHTYFEFDKYFLSLLSRESTLSSPWNIRTMSNKQAIATTNKKDPNKTPVQTINPKEIMDIFKPKNKVSLYKGVSESYSDSDNVIPQSALFQGKRTISDCLN